MCKHTGSRASNLGSSGLATSELVDRLGALRDGVASELTGEAEADGGLDLAAREGGLLVDADEATGLSGDLLEDIVDEGVHDGHGTLGDTGVGVDLAEDLEDVRGVGLSALLGTLVGLLLTGGGLRRGLGGNRLLGSNHCCNLN